MAAARPPNPAPTTRTLIAVSDAAILGKDVVEDGLGLRWKRREMGFFCEILMIEEMVGI